MLGVHDHSCLGVFLYFWFTKLHLQYPRILIDMDLITFVQISKVNLINLAQVSDFIWALVTTYNKIVGSVKLENYLTT